MEDRAAQLGLRCGLLAVLTAVLALLCGYKRLRDDEVAIRHVAARIPAGARCLSATTIGRLLRKLDRLELIVYRPACGRGRSAYIAIHPSLCDGVSELARDANGRVITADSAPQAPPPTGADPGPSPAPQPVENVEFFAPAFLIERSPRKDNPYPLQKTVPTTSRSLPDRPRSPSKPAQSSEC